MFAKVSYDDTSGRAQKLQLRAGQRLSIGASFSADIVLRNSQGVAGEHAEIFFKHQKCSIRNLTGSPKKLLINGQPTKQTDLANGDAIEIGSNQMSFEMEPSEKSGIVPAIAAAPVAVAATSEPVISNGALEPKSSVEMAELQFERHSNGVTIISVEDFAELIHPIFEEAKPTWTYHLICNHKLSQLKGDPPSELNYLETGPNKISDSNDLYFTSFEDNKEALPMLLKYGKVNAGLLGICAPDVDPAEVATQLKFLATWFMIPANLKFHVINGSSLLLDKIFSLFEILVIPDDNENIDWLILNDPTIDGIESFIDKIKGASDDLGT